MNSRSVTRAPASKAIAMPSPVAIAGFVVSRKTWPAPPVAISVRPASTCSSFPSRPTNVRASTLTVARHQRHRERIVEDTHAPDATDTFCQSTRPISRPVASRACSTRRTAVRGLTAKRRLLPPIAIERGAPRRSARDVARTVADKHVDRLWHTEAVARRRCVSRACSSGESSGPIAAAMPPCA